MAFTTLLRRRRPSTLDPRITTSELGPVASEPSSIASEPRPIPSRQCSDQAKRLIHKYAAFGTVWALLPVPMATSAGLALLETHLIYWIARIYGEEPKKTDVVMTAAGLELASVGLKTVAIEGAALVPVIGLGVKASIAGSVVLAIGAAIVKHYEHKYPGKQIAA
jgi:uncharacterized protein (DUF697 family)